MKMKHVFFGLFLTVISLDAYGQKPQMTLQKNASNGYNPFSWGLKYSYYGPKTTNVSSVFDALEETAGLPQGSQFRIYYLAGANLRYSLDARNDIGVEGEMNLSQSKLFNVKSVGRVYVVGAQYYYHLQQRKPGFFGVDIGGGIGWQVTNFERNYDNSNRHIAILAQSVRLNGAVEWWAALSRSLYLELEARYIYVPNIKINYPQTTIKMSSIVTSVGFSVVL